MQFLFDCFVFSWRLQNVQKLCLSENNACFFSSLSRQIIGFPHLSLICRQMFTKTTAGILVHLCRHVLCLDFNKATNSRLQLMVFKFSLIKGHYHGNNIFRSHSPERSCNVCNELQSASFQVFKLIKFYYILLCSWKETWH